jgi:hypothetical protein
MKTLNDATAEDFDSYVLVNRQLLKDANLMPSTWGLPNGESARICLARVALFPVSWPALKWTPTSCSHIKHLVIFDTLYLRTGSIRQPEFKALLLHEIGHVVNPPKNYNPADTSESEFYADDYVRHCGFAEDLANCLEVLMRLDPDGFDFELTMMRINRIKNDDTLLLNLFDISLI